MSSTVTYGAPGTVKWADVGGNSKSTYTIPSDGTVAAANDDKSSHMEVFAGFVVVGTSVSSGVIVGTVDTTAADLKVTVTTNDLNQIVGLDIQGGSPGDVASTTATYENGVLTSYTVNFVGGGSQTMTLGSDGSKTSTTTNPDGSWTSKVIAPDGSVFLTTKGKGDTPKDPPAEPPGDYDPPPKDPEDPPKDPDGPTQIGFLAGDWDGSTSDTSGSAIHVTVHGGDPLDLPGSGGDTLNWGALPSGGDPISGDWQPVADAGALNVGRLIDYASDGDPRETSGAGGLRPPVGGWVGISGKAATAHSVGTLTAHGSAFKLNRVSEVISAFAVRA